MMDVKSFKPELVTFAESLRDYYWRKISGTLALAQPCDKKYNELLNGNQVELKTCTCE